MRWIIAVLVAMLGANWSAGQEAVAIYDTEGRFESILKRSGWVQVSEDKLAHKFAGDAVLTNGRVVVVFRAGAAAVEVYSTIGKSLQKLSDLCPAGAGNAKLSGVKILENTPAGGKISATFQSSGGKAEAISFELKVGQVFLAAQGQENGGLRIGAPCRFAVLPDFFADDIVIDATTLPGNRAELPSENFLLHLLSGGNAIVMAVWTQRDQDIKVTLKDQRIDASDIPFGKNGQVWVACLTGQGIWHSMNVSKRDAGKIVSVDWKPPIPAQWRMDWRRGDQLADSWEMITQRADGAFSKYGVFGSPDTIPSTRRRWTTVLGTFAYPCWIEKDGKAFIQPLKEGVVFDGPAVIYPMTRIKETPLDAFTVVDIVRGSLGVGPCEYILDLEGQKSEYKGRATCANRDTLNPIYEKGQQKQRRAEIEKSLKEVLVFIKHIRGRIESYVDFGHEVLNYLAEQKKAHPELEKPIGELEKLTKQIDQRVADRRKAIKTPEEAAAMIEAFRTNDMDREGQDGFDRCKKFTAAIVDIGGNQDELAGEGRMVIKMVRQRAALLMAADARMAEIAREIRGRSQKTLRNPANHEGARH